MLIFDESGNVVLCTLKLSPWYVMYMSHPNEECMRFHSKFRRRFRIPYSEYRVLVNDVHSCARFKRWVSHNAVSDETSPIELLVLGSLH